MELVLYLAQMLDIAVERETQLDQGKLSVGAVLSSSGPSFATMQTKLSLKTVLSRTVPPITTLLLGKINRRMRNKRHQKANEPVLNLIISTKLHRTLY